jgi:1,4-dihydroxy-2-naphthoyl-CoA hydrolase
MDPSTREEVPQIAEARVTLLCNLPLPEDLKNTGDFFDEGFLFH